MGKAQSSFLIELNLLLPLSCLSALTCHHLTQPAGLASIHRGTGSMIFCGNAAGPAGSTLKEAALLCPSRCYNL